MKTQNNNSEETNDQSCLSPVSGSLPCEQCDEACYYHCTKGGQQLPDCKSDEKLYTEKDMIESARYGYEYRATTSFPYKNFDDNCKNNFLQHLFSKFGISYR